MVKSKERPFLQKQRSRIIQNIKCPIQLADDLLAKEFISNETYNIIVSLQTCEEQMRKIYKYLTSSKALEFAYEWMKENEADLIEDLEMNSESECGPPDGKRPRIDTVEAVDETDGLNSSDWQTFFKKCNSLAKMERWVSDPKNEQTVIEKLQEKLAEGEKEVLEKALKDKKLKKCLCFTANDVTKINSDRSLQSYLERSNNARFPVKLTLGVLFEKNRDYVSPGSYSSGSHHDDNESTDVREEDLISSGYGSSFSPGLKSSQSLNHDQFLFDTEKKPSESLSSHDMQGETSGRLDTEALHAGPPLTHVAADQQGAFKSEKCGLTKAAETDGPQTPSAKHADCLAYDPWQNEPPTRQKPEKNDPMTLNRSVDKQESAEDHCRFPDGDLCQKEPPEGVGSAPREEAVDFEDGLDETTTDFDPATPKSEQFSCGTPVQSLGPQDEHKGQNYPKHAQNKLLILMQGENNDDPAPQQSVSTQESPGLAQVEKKQTNSVDHEIRPHEPTVPLADRHFAPESLNAGPRLAGVAANAPVQNAGLASQDAQQCEKIAETPQTSPVRQAEVSAGREINGHMALSVSTDKQESPSNNCVAEFENSGRNDATTTAEAMETGVRLDETNGRFDPETLHNEQLPSSALSGVPDAPAPVPNVDLDEHDVEICIVNKGAGPPAVKHTDAQVLTLIKSAPFTQQQPGTNDHMALGKSKGQPEGAGSVFLIGEEERFGQLDETCDKGATATQEAMDTESNGPEHAYVVPGNLGQNSREPGEFLPSLGAQEEPSFSSTPLNGSKQRKDDRKKRLTESKLKRTIARASMLQNWATERCGSNGEGELRNEHFSIVNVAEHAEYPFLVAEKVRVYKNPEKDEQKIVVLSNGKKISNKTKIEAHYQMFVCGVEKAVILGQDKQEILLDISKVPLSQCLKFLSEAFIPALAVFKNMQRRNELDHLLMVKGPNL